MIRRATIEDARDLVHEEWQGHITPDMLKGLDAWSYLEDSVVKAMGGVELVRPHVGMAWVVAHDNLQGKIGLAKTIKTALWEFMEKKDLFRLEAHTRGKQGERLLQWLGFKHEGTARCFDGFNDYEQYALVIE